MATATAPLQQSLEKLAEGGLSAPSLSGGSDQIIRLSSDDPSRDADRVTKLVQQLGGAVLPSFDEGTNKRLLAQVQKNQVTSLKEAIRDGAEVLPDENSPSSPENDARVLVEIMIEKKSP